MNAYGVIAKVYDLFLDDYNYKGYAEYVKSTIKKYSLSGIVVDAGCGTGTMLKLLDDISNQRIGIDISSEMLSIAQRKNLNALLLQQDITKLKLIDGVSLVYSSLDVINHLKSLKDIERFFNQVSKYLMKDGFLIFDLNLPYKHEHILADNCFTYEKYKYMLIWNSFLHKDRVNISLDLFTKQEDGLYLRESEEFSEYTYKLEEIVKLLEDDFTLVDVIDGDSFTSLRDSSNRALITARRK